MADWTIRVLPDGRTVEHVHTTFVEQIKDELVLDEHVLVDGVMHTVRVRVSVPEGA